MSRRLVLFILLFCFPSAAWSQKMIVAEGDYTYYTPPSVSLEQAKEIALERAKVQIIADHFGTVISSVTSTKIENVNDISTVSMSSVGDSEVKGEWIETIGEPRYSISYQQDMLVVNATVKGRIREILSAPVDFKAKVLCNGVEDKFERYDFKSGDELYFSFLSPVDGYLVLYLYDGLDKVFRLLPYRGQKDNVYPINAGTRYLFFSRLSAQNINGDYWIDEYAMKTEQDQEINRLFILFSTKPYHKAVEQADSSDTLPGYLSWTDFRRWLIQNRRYDKDLRLEIKDIIITK